MDSLAMQMDLDIMLNWLQHWLEKRMAAVHMALAMDSAMVLVAAYHASQPYANCNCYALIAFVVAVDSAAAVAADDDDFDDDDAEIAGADTNLLRD